MSVIEAALLRIAGALEELVELSRPEPAPNVERPEPPRLPTHEDHDASVEAQRHGAHRAEWVVIRDPESGRQAGERCRFCKFVVPAPRPMRVRP